MVLLVSKCGFTRATYFLINAARWAACKRKPLASLHLLHVIAKLASAVAVIAVVVSAASVLRVRKESGYRVETVAPVGIGHRVHKESARHVHRASVHLVRKESAHRVVSVRLASRVHRASVLHARKETGHHAPRGSVPHVLNRLRQFSQRQR